MADYLATAEYLGLHEATKSFWRAQTVCVVCPVKKSASKVLEKGYGYPSSHFTLHQEKNLKSSCGKCNILQFLFTWKFYLASKIKL